MLEDALPLQHFPYPTHLLPVPRFSPISQQLFLLFPAEIDISSQEIQNKLSTAYLHFLYLFGYRSKILWAYHQSRKPASKLKQDFREVESLIATVAEWGDSPNPSETDLQKLSQTLKKTLTILSKYETGLSDLEYQNRTLQTNLDNYRQRLQKIQKFDGNSNLELWENFADFAQQKYQRQIETDIANLRPGLTLLENLIRTIEGTIDIYQTAGERRLNLTVASVGTGLAVSSVVVGVIATEPPPDKPAVRTIGISLFLGLLAGIVTWLVLKLSSRSANS